MNPDAPIVEIPEQKVIKSSPSHLVILFFVILGIAALSALGTYYYLLPQLKSNTPQTTVQYQQSSDQSNTNINNTQQVTPVIGNTQANTDPDTIAHSLIDAWLNNSKSSSTPTEKRITDYTFTISNISLNGDMLRFQVDYSVKPVNINQTDWAAGNGQIDTAAGWIYHKTSFVLATNVNGVYTITKMATSPL